MFWKKPLPTPEKPSKIEYSLEKIDANIDRFRRAYESCEKGDDRRLQLKSNLEFWEGLKALTYIERI